MATAAANNRNQMRKARKLRSLALFVLGAGLLILGIVASLLLLKPNPSNAGTGEASPYTPAKVDYPAPDLALTALNGQETSLSDYRGQVVLVNNWATWCPPCREEMPVLEAYYQDYKDQDFVIIGIEAGEPAAQVATFVEGYGMTFPIWLDPEQKALRAFRNDALPSSYVVDREGHVRLVWVGVVNRAVLDQYLAPMLSEQD